MAGAMLSPLHILPCCCCLSVGGISFGCFIDNTSSSPKAAKSELPKANYLAESQQTQQFANDFRNIYAQARGDLNHCLAAGGESNCLGFFVVVSQALSHYALLLAARQRGTWRVGCWARAGAVTQHSDTHQQQKLVTADDARRQPRRSFPPPASPAGRKESGEM